jgi:ABC-2 type transport system ATP-binding protein
MAALVEVSDLARRFAKVEAVQGVSFSIARGEVLGFIGPNGAGKTTTLRLMATLAPPTSGTVRVDGLDTRTDASAIRRRVGWLPDSFPRCAGLTAWEFLDFFARAHGFGGRDRAQRVAEVVEFVGLEDLLERDVGTLSRGMSQRLLLGRALLHDPDVLLMDEPAAGLDPQARIEFRRLVRLLGEEGKAVFVSSHILSELEEMCDTFLLIDRGRIVHHGSAESLKRGELTVMTVLVRVTGAVDALRSWALMSPGVRIVDALKDGLRLELDSSDPAFLVHTLRALVEAGVPVMEYRIGERRLEEAFVAALTRNNVS